MKSDCRISKQCSPSASPLVQKNAWWQNPPDIFRPILVAFQFLKRLPGLAQLTLDFYERIGPEESRTPGLCNANAALYQLSYRPLILILALQGFQGPTQLTFKILTENWAGLKFFVKKIINQSGIIHNLR